MGAEIQLGACPDRAVVVTPTQAQNPYPWGKILTLVQTSFTYMENRIDPPSSMHLLTTDAIAKQSEIGEIWVIEQQGTPIACVFMTPKTNALYIGKLSVSDSHRGKGLARLLVDCAAQRARTLGFDRLKLQTRIQLVENHCAFERMGFRKTGETTHAGYDHPTSITMQKELT